MNNQTLILLFDGECTFCNVWISFIKKNGSSSRFKYLPLQSEEALKLLSIHQVNKDLDSILVIKKEVVHSKSSAALVIINELGGWWNLAKVIYLIPKPVRDWAYDLIAKNRHRFFSTKSNCDLHN